MASLLFRFQQDAHNYLTHVPALDDLSSWYALMQHFNAPTPLMDWTESPFVAAYFALEDKPSELREGDREPHSGVWAINLDWLEEKRKQLFGEVNDSNELLRQSAPTVVRINPPMSNPRLFAQQGVFLAKLFDKASFGQLLMTMMMRPDLAEKPVIRRMEVGTSVRIEFLKRLRSMNIHRASLFPGLDGLGALLKHDLELVEKVESYSTHFLPGHERKVFTSVSEQCTAGDCGKCPGILGKGGPVKKWIFCVHDCHKVKDRDLIPEGTT
jgi:FRG domain